MNSSQTEKKDGATVASPPKKTDWTVFCAKHTISYSKSENPDGCPRCRKEAAK